MEDVKKKLLVMLVMLNSIHVQAYDNKITHRELTLAAVKNPVLKSEAYLSKNFTTVPRIENIRKM